MEHGHWTAEAVAHHLVTHDNFHACGRPWASADQHRDVGANRGPGNRKPGAGRLAQYLAGAVCASDHHCAWLANHFGSGCAEQRFRPPVPRDHVAFKIDREGWAGDAGDLGLDLLH
jgi:hypothetical protein